MDDRHNTARFCSQSGLRQTPLDGRWATWLLAGAGLILIAVGCRSKSTFEFDELDLVPAQEDLTEFSLGRFAIPIPLGGKEFGDDASPRNRVQFVRASRSFQQGFQQKLCVTCRFTAGHRPNQPRSP